MQFIRVLIKDSHVEVSFESGDRKLPVESIQKINLQIVLDYLENWQNWVKQMDALSFALPGEENDYTSRFQEFQSTLYSLLFGNLSNSLDEKEIVWILDSELMSLPVEILQNRTEQIFYRNIRTVFIPPTNLKGEGYLYVENHYDASSLMQKMIAEREEILGTWDRDNILYKQIIGAGCTRIRFIEKITGVTVLHYSGHSFENGIYFTDGAFLNYTDLSTMNLSNLNLVSLNSCSSAIGLARGFLEAGAKECIGFLGPIRNDLSYEIGKIFWEKYRTTNNAGYSVLETRKLLEEKYGKGFPALYQFVHFGTPKRIEKNKKKLIYFLLSSFSLLLSILMLYKLVFVNKYKEEDRKETIIPIKPVKESNTTPETKDIVKQKVKETQTIEIKTLTKNPKKQVKLEKPGKSEQISIIKKESFPKETENKVLEYYIPQQQPRIHKYIDALQSNSLKQKIRRYLNKEDTLYTYEKKVEVLEKILEFTDSEDLIEYKLGNLH